MALAAVLMVSSISCSDRGSVSEFKQSLLEPTSGLQMGVKTAEQLNLTFSTLTGVPHSRGDIREAYNRYLPQLPATNDIASFQAAHQTGILKLATEYCHILVDTPMYRAQIWPGIDFSLIPTNIFGPKGAVDNENRKRIVHPMIDRFWGTRLANLPDEAQSRAAVLALLDELVGPAELTGAGTRNIVKGVCVSVLAASPVTLL